MKREFPPQPAAQGLTVGKLARLAQVSADTVRFYEKEGLLAPARKSAAGYRLYGEDAARRLRFIKHAQECGLSLAEVRELLTLRTAENACCTDVKSVAVHKKLVIEAKIRTLQTMSQALSELIARCDGGELPLDACAILAALEAAEPRRAPQEAPTP
ncbi:heavy metal-responsive transcriptional regulator [Aromatoleum toluclasticum]|uniref:heavy metal-responsive transcriptional regulator n=1 Tax=Aromatoleum toluclasticum TaxID=92003 RepID=UPI00037A7139|nr:heavy metal-responsive transcriptional regulator [Aromatoleum toluclasticum]